MKVKFLKDIDGSIDGIRVKKFETGKVYQVNGTEITQYLYESWKAKGDILEEVIEEKSVAPKENKAIAKAPENKSFEESKEEKKPAKKVSKKGK